jgi:hypothetical protein
MGNIKHKDNTTLLSELFDLFLEVKSVKEDDELFKEWEIDVNSVVAKNMILFRQLKTKTKAELYQLRYNRIFGFLDDIKKGLKENSQKFSALTDEILSKPKYAELQPMFRNLTNLTDDDKKSILLDAKLLDLLDELENKLP